MSTLRRLHHQDERRQLQSHDLRRLWLRVLLAMHEGDIRPALPEVSSFTQQIMLLKAPIHSRS